MCEKWCKHARKKPLPRGPRCAKCTRAQPRRNRELQVKAVAGDEVLAAWVYVLCDDGTMWWCSVMGEDGWYELPPIPQPDDAPEETL